MGLRAAYIDLFCGAKAYFGAKESSQAAAFGATCLLSGLTMGTAACFLGLFDMLVFRELRWSQIVFGNRIVTTGLALTVYAAHSRACKTLGIYEGPIPSRPASWPRNIFLIVAAALSALSATCLIIYIVKGA